jgi:hypothetical protein
LLNWVAGNVWRATGFTYLFSLCVWFLFFNQFARGRLQISMGLGGALYPLFFSLPVIVGTLLYEFGLTAAASRLGLPSLATASLWRLGVPCLLSFIELVAFCPMDGPGTFVGALWQRLF